MFNLNDLKVGTKILTGYILALVLLVIVGVVAIIRVNAIDSTVTYLADNAAKQQHLADQFVSQIWAIRLYAVKYINRPNPEDAKQFNQEIEGFKTILAEAETIMTTESRATKLASVKTGVDEYATDFTEITRLITKRENTKTSILDVQGPLAEEKLDRLRQNAAADNNNLEIARLTGDAQRDFLLMRLNAYKYLEDGDEQWTQKFNEAYQQYQTDAAALAEKIQLASHRILLSEIQTATQAYHDGFNALQSDYARQNQLFNDKLSVIGPQVRQTGLEISAGVTQDFAAASQETHALVAQTRNLVLGVMVGSIIAGVALGLVISRSITKPLAQVTQAARLIAEGDVSQTLNINRRDEIGLMADAFKKMIVYLEQMVAAANKLAQGNLATDVRPQSDKDALGNAFAQMVANLREQIHEIVNSSNVLAASISQISATTSQLTTNSAETATSVSETTTTIEEVRQTAQITTEKARYVSEIATGALQKSQLGKEASERAITGMNRVGQHMEAIAESIVKLSEQSQTIAEIIATVDDLAEQSNLLAVNAAIEAAKAGEQGKGFAVVAQEIKSLAEQSKQATTQVRRILTDIQKATGTAVMATEQGSKAVEAGLTQAAEAGAAILALTESITESAQSAAQIAASSQQQLVGMDQVAMAMENINQASSQNVEGSMQLKSATYALEGMGQKLKSLVARYAG